jgi:uncharacterized membrane-anchored protein
MSLPLKIAFWATVAGQIILLLAFIAFKEDTLRSGTSVLLETAPVDPRSILQGDFAILDYKIAELPNWAKDSDLGEPFYVQLYEHPNGVWVADAYTREEPRGYVSTSRAPSMTGKDWNLASTPFSSLREKGLLLTRQRTLKSGCLSVAPARL